MNAQVNMTDEEYQADIEHLMICRIAMRQDEDSLVRAALLYDLDLPKFREEHAEEITFAILKRQTL